LSILPLVRLLDSAIKEVCNVRILLGFGHPQLLESCPGNYLSDVVLYIDLWKEDRQVIRRVVLSETQHAFRCR
jgi:hypothetical protein